MTADPARWSDLVSEMQALVWEEAPLHELTNQVTDHGRDGSTIVHGPWTAEECQSVLMPWHVAGWIDLVADADPVPGWQLRPADWHTRASRQGAFLILSKEDATDLLREPERWIVGTADGYVTLCRSDEGLRHDYPEWRKLAEQARSGA